jgi:hypothetical protein
MILSHAKRFVMFLPWKTASQTTASRIAAYNESPYSRFFHFNPHLCRVVHQHLICADFAALPESKNGYFLASFTPLLSPISPLLRRPPSPATTLRLVARPMGHSPV